MNICIVSPFDVLPPITGARRRVFEIAAALCEAGVSVTVLHPGQSESTESGVRFVGFTGLQSLSITRDLPVSIALETYLASASLALPQKLLTILRRQRFDILQIEGPWSIFPCQIALKLHRIPLVYDAHNVESISVAQSSSVPWMAPYATFVEKRAVEGSDRVSCVSEVDKRNMCELYHLQPSKVNVVPNGVWISRYRKDSATQVKLRHSLDKESKIILFHGALGWKPNAEAAQEIVDSIASEMDTKDSHAVFLIVGPQASRKLLKRAEHRHNVRILGPVDDIADYVCSADVCIAPMKTGSGTKLKILEYLAAQKPVVATRKAVEGIGIQDGKQALLADSTGNEFIDLIKTAMTAETSELLASNAAAFVQQFDWSIIVKKILDIYDTIVA